MMSKAIGVFDSGLGGVSVLNSCMEILPNEDFLYYADSKNAPYGDKSEAELIGIIDRVVSEQFIHKGVKAIVIACNTATNIAVDFLRGKYKNIPIIGIEPAIKPAIEYSYSNVLVLATEATINSKRFTSRLLKFDKEGKCLTVGCSGLVELIESEPNFVEEYLREKLQFLDGIELDSVVLGCTHYPFIKNEIVNVLGKNIKFFDGSKGVAQNLHNILLKMKIRNYENNKGNLVIDSSLGDEYNKKIIKYIRR